MVTAINKLAEKLERAWIVDKDSAGSIGKSFIDAPEQRQGSNDCGATVNELVRRLVYNESIKQVDLAAHGNLLRIRQASEILQFILQVGVN